MPKRLWIIILCAGSIMALSVGLRQSFGLFLTPISDGLGLGRESFALAMGLSNLFWGLAAPAAGAIADRYGAGRVAVLGGIAYAAGLAVLMMSGDGTDLLIGGTLIGFGLSGSGFTVILGVVGSIALYSKETMFVIRIGRWHSFKRSQLCRLQWRLVESLRRMRVSPDIPFRAEMWNKHTSQQSLVAHQCMSSSRKNSGQRKCGK